MKVGLVTLFIHGFVILAVVFSQLESSTPAAAAGQSPSARSLSLVDKSVGTAKASQRFPRLWGQLDAKEAKLPAVRLAASIVTVKNRALSPSAKLFVDCTRQVINVFRSERELGARTRNRSA